MCLLTIAGKGTNKYSDMLFEALRIAAESNKDGMGYSFKKASTKKVYISKGYNTVDGLIRSLRSHRLKDNDELIIHQRIGNKGAKNIDMCHPFVLSNEKEAILSNDSYVDFPILAHNGTFHKYSKHNSDFSDTFWFIQEFIHRPEFLALLKNDIYFFKEFFKTDLGTNKLCLLFPNEDTSLIKLGEFKEDQGYFFSNDSYKDKTIQNVGGVTSKIGLLPAARQAARGYDDMWDEETRHHALNSCLDVEDEDEELEGDNNYTQRTPGGGWTKYVNKNVQTELFKYSRHVANNIIVNSGETAECIESYIKYRLYMDMWIPEKYNTPTQFESIRWNPTEFNFGDFIFRGLSNEDDEGVKKDTYYRMISYDATSIRGGLEGLHTLQVFYKHEGLRNNTICIPGYRLATLFNIIPVPKYIIKYRDYYRLCQELNASKNVLKSLNKLMDVTTYVEKDGKLTFKGIKDLSPAALSLFQMLLTKYIFPKTYIAEINKQSMVIAN